MKTLYTITLAIVLATNSFAQVTDTLVMVWNDEFNGTELDAKKWQTCPEWHRQGGSYWEDDNQRLNGGGKLKLKVTERNDSVFCGAIRTRGLFQQKYGYYEVRCKVPQIQGGWAAFWMMPMQNKAGGWGNDGTEIDIFESINGWNGKINHALHWDGYGSAHQKASQSTSRPDLYDNKMHVFGMMWTPNEYIFYIDNVETWRTSAGGVSDVEQYLKLTMEVSSDTWAGNWNNQVTKPIYWTIDYVRVYAYGERKYKPEITLSKPLEGQVFNLEETVKLKAVITGEMSGLDEIKFVAQKDGGVNKVLKLRNVDGSKYEFYASWTPTEAGTYTLKVKGYKNGAFVTNSLINVTVKVNQRMITNIHADLNKSVKIYPNPVVDDITVAIENEMVIELKLFSLSGQVLKQTYNVSRLSMEALPKGQYFLQIKTKSGLLFRRNVVK